MKKNIFAMFAAAALMLGMASCANEDNPTPAPEPEPTPSISDKDLVGVWWEEYEYADVTEDGVPFTSVVMAVRADDDNTGCIYLGVFDGKSEEPLAVYGGFEESGFTWDLLEDGRVLLGDPETGETYSLSRTRGDSSYGKDMTNVANTKLTYNSNGTVTATNGSSTETLSKASSEKAEELIKQLDTKIQSNVKLGNGGKAPKDFDEDDIR